MLREDQMKTLTSLAILKVDIDEGRSDYLGYLQQFVIHLLNENRLELITAENVSLLLRNVFGLNIPVRGTQLVLRRMIKKGYLEKKEDFYQVSSKLPYISFNEKMSIAKRNIQNVYNSLIRYAKESFNIKWTEMEASNAILSFLSRFGVDFLRAYIFNTALPEISKTDPREQYIISRFICNLRESSNPCFDNVTVLVKGHMYANALLCPDLESIQKKFNDVTFYFDTKLVLNLLGIQNKQQKELVDELCYLIKQLKGTIAVFGHTIDEIHGILTHAEKNIDNLYVSGDVLCEVRRNNIKRSGIILIRENLDEQILKLNLKIHVTPKYEEQYQISENELQEAVKEEITYRNPKALAFDINSVRSIYVLRAGKVPHRLEDAGAVFVTTNDILAKAAYKVGQRHNSTREVSSVITDYSLANVAWLKAPLGAPELPIKEMFAACYAAMEPPESLWEKYIDEIDSLKKSGQISPENHAILRFSDIAINELMNLTLGEEKALSGGDIKVILDRVKERLVSEKEEEIQIERNKKEEIRIQRDKAINETQKIEENIYWVSSKLAKYISLILLTLVLSLLVICLFLSPYITTSFIANSKSLTMLVNSCILFGALWAIMNWYYGVTLKEIKESIEIRSQRIISKYLKAKLTK